jgi:polyhydroxyalkanoate synthesis regulator phasin
VFGLPRLIEDRFVKESTMLQSSEIQKRFSHIQQTISEATRSCQSAQSVPQDLKRCVEELDKECKTAQSAMKSQDEDRMRECIDSLEQIGDRAERACEHAGNVDGNLKRAVSTMHSELSDLKRQLH